MNFTSIDWLGYRTQDQPVSCLDTLRESFGLLGITLRAVPKKRGKQGFERSDSLCLGDLVVGSMSFGGEAMRGWVWVEITGKGCQWIEDWSICQKQISSLKDFEYKRVDIALDTYLREVTFETVSQAYAEGLFTTCGKPPSMRSIVPFDPVEGRTIYVGKRDQPKYFRGYEKGYELIKDFPRHLNIDTLDGHKVADMFRCELELKAKNHHLPLDLLVNRDNYFSGAYPYLKTVLDVEPKVLRVAREENARRSLASMLEVLRNQYGNTLFTALAAHDGDIGAVWSKVVGFKHNEKLLEDGVLMVNHD